MFGDLGVENSSEQKQIKKGGKHVGVWEVVELKNVFRRKEL